MERRRPGSSTDSRLSVFSKKTHNWRFVREEAQAIAAEEALRCAEADIRLPTVVRCPMTTRKAGKQVADLQYKLQCGECQKPLTLHRCTNCRKVNVVHADAKHYRCARCRRIKYASPCRVLVGGSRRLPRTGREAMLQKGSLLAEGS